MSDTAPAPAPTEAKVAGIFSIASGLIHGVAAGLHAEHPTAARAFAVLALVQVVAGLASLFADGRRVRGLVAAVNAASVVGWVVAKTVGIGFIDGLKKAESVQATDLLCAVLAALAVLFAISPRLPTSY